MAIVIDNVVSLDSTTQELATEGSSLVAMAMEGIERNVDSAPNADWSAWNPIRAQLEIVSKLLEAIAARSAAASTYPAGDVKHAVGTSEARGDAVRRSGSEQGPAGDDGSASQGAILARLRRKAIAKATAAKPRRRYRRKRGR